MADSEVQPQPVGIQIKPTVEQAVDSSSQITTKTPTTRPKIPKRVAAGKAITKRTRLAREEQKRKRQKLTEKKQKLLWWLTHHQLNKTRTPQ